jgi:hypothetical protein
MSSDMTISFDDSIPTFVLALVTAGIDASLNNGVIIRDMRGRLSFISREPLAEATIDIVEKTIPDELRHYISPLGPVADLNAPGADRVLDSSEAVRDAISIPDTDTFVEVAVLDRRAVGADWLHPPYDGAKGRPPVLVFASLKGGVGRSTALSVLAADLADRGHALLVIDLDLEAPGIGSMLIESEATPRFGSLDYFVESTLRRVDDTFLQDCIGSSWLSHGRGRIDVVPAYGIASIAHPRNVLSKLARTYLESEGPEGESVSLLTHVQRLVAQLTDLRRYDAVLVDARAGLHESTAAALLGLGADVLLFGVDQPQTFVGYKILLSHLAQFPVRDVEHDWRYRLRMVQAKATSENSIGHYRGQSYDLFDEIFYSKTAAPSDSIGLSFQFGIDDSDAPHFPITILEDERYRLFDPVQERAQLSKEMYFSYFEGFIKFCVERLQLEASDDK